MTISGSSLSGSGSAADTALRVMSFNVRYGLAFDGNNSWPFRYGVFINAVRHCAADLIGFQECLDFQVKFIEQELPDYGWFGIGREKDGSGEYAAVFYKKDVLEVEETSYFWLSDTPDVKGSRSWNAVCTRMVSFGRFHHLKTGQRFHFFNTHFDHGSELAREESAKMLLKRIEAQPELPVIVTGDFNAPAEYCVPWEILTRGGLTDAWVACQDKKGPEYTCIGFEQEIPAQPDRIDWILYRGNIQPRAIEIVTYSENGRFPSDHYPVCADFQIWG